MTATVWIIGAGFPRSLGSPLLMDLMSESLTEEMLNRCATAALANFSKRSIAAAELYWNARDGYRSANPPLSGPRIGIRTWAMAWASDAELFLSHVDWLCSDAKNARIEAERSAFLRRFDVEMKVIGNFSDLANDLRRIIAAQTAIFSEAPDLENDERWLPYRDWAHRLQPNDTIICWNYDETTDILSEWRAQHSSSFESPIPANLTTDYRAPLVLRPHGSNRWQLQNDAIMGIPNGVFSLLEVDAYVPAIATPGARSKMQFSNTLTAPMWRMMEKRLVECDVVNWVGYRCPESDAMARRALVKPLQETTSLVNIVLGNDGSMHAARLKSMIDRGRHEKAKAHIVPEWAQDFIGL